MEIDKGRGNACQLLGRALYQLGQAFPCRLVCVDGGMKDNAIPRHAAATLIVDAAAADAWEEEVRRLGETYAAEYRLTDSGVKVTIAREEEAPVWQAMTAEATKRVIAALVNLPGGIQRMSFDIEGLVQTSLNLGILQTEEQETVFSFAVRSNVGSEKEELVARIRCLAEAFGGTVESHGDYPAWEYRQDSALRDLMVQVFEEQYGRKPQVEAIHAGVECGLFAGKLPGLDCVSFGPDMNGIHTPQESMKADSVRRTWEYLLEILKRLK